MKKTITLFTLLFLFSAYAQEAPSIMRMHIVELADGNNPDINQWAKVWETQSRIAVKENHWAGWMMLRGVRDRKKLIFLHIFNDPSQIRGVFSKFKSPKSLGIEAPKQWPKWKTIEMDLWEPRSNVEVQTTSNFYAISFWRFTNAQRKNFITVNEMFGNNIANPRAKIDPSYDWGYATRITGGSYENNQPLLADGVSFDGYESYEKYINTLLSKQKRSPKFADKVNEDMYFQKFKKEMDQSELWGKWHTGREVLLFEVVGTTFR